MFILFSSHTVVFYSIVLHSNDEEHSVTLDQLDNINGLPLSKKDATIKSAVIRRRQKQENLFSQFDL